MQQLLKLRWPLDLRLLIHQPLGFGHLSDPGKIIILALILQTQLIHLPGQPFPPIEANLNLKGKPRLQPQMHKPKHRMLLIEVKMHTFALGKHRLQAVNFIGLTGFHTPQDANQSFGYRAFPGNSACYVFFANPGRIEIYPWPIGLLKPSVLPPPVSVGSDSSNNF